MEGITRLVSESLARHGFDRPLDYRRLRWSRWFRCESPHSLLVVPSKPGVFALAEEVAQIDDGDVSARSRMLAVTQFFEDDDMAFVLDRMLSSQNPMRARLISGHYFVRFVVIEEQSQRRSICSALNQWLAGSGEKVSGIGAHFATSLELTDVRVGTATLESLPRAQSRGPAERSSAADTVLSITGNSSSPSTAPQPDSGAAANIHCPAPFPSGF